MPLRSRRSPAMRALTMQLIGAVPVQHLSLVPVDDPTAAVAARTRVHIEEVIAGVAFGMCKCQQAFAGDDRGNELGSLLGAGAFLQ